MLATKKREYPVQRPHVFEQAKQAEQASEIDKAESLYRKIILGELDHIGAGLGLARLHFDREYYLESYLLLEHLEAIDPENPTILSLKQEIETYYQAFGVSPAISDDMDYDITSFDGGTPQKRNKSEAPKPEPSKLEQPVEEQVVEEQVIEEQAIGEIQVVEELPAPKLFEPEIDFNITETPQIEPPVEVAEAPQALQEPQAPSTIPPFNGAYLFTRAVEYIIEFDEEEAEQVPSPQPEPQFVKIKLSDDF